MEGRKRKKTERELNKCMSLPPFSPYQIERGTGETKGGGKEKEENRERAK